MRIYATYLEKDGTPERGNIYLIPYVRTAAGDTIYTENTVVCRLENGVLDVDVQPGAYIVQERVAGRYLSYSIESDVDVNLAEITPIEAPNLTYMYPMLSSDPDNIATLGSDNRLYVGAQEAGGVITDHGLLNGLADNDHPQYELAANATAAHNALQTSINSHTHPSMERGVWIYDTATTPSSPGSGRVRTDTATFNTATKVYLSETTANGLDVSPLLELIQVGDLLAFQQESNSSNWGRARVTGAVVDNGTWRTIPVEYVDGGGTGVSKNQNVVIQVTFGTGGGGGTVSAVTSVNTQTGDVVLDAADVSADPAGTANSAVATHEAAGDPHSQYLTDAEHAALDHTGIPGVGGSGTTDHGALTGLADNDHPQYSLTTHNHTGVYDPAGSAATAQSNAETYSDNQMAAHLIDSDPHTIYLVADDIAAGSNVTLDKVGNSITIHASGTGGTSDHGALTGLADDDHPQYLLANGTRPASTLRINGAAGSERLLRFTTADTARWTMGVTPANETGSNSGSDFTVARWADNGAWIDNPLTIYRSSGAVNMPGTVGIGTLTAVTGLARLGPTSGFNSVHTGCIRALRSDASASSTLIAAYPTQAAFDADTPAFEVVGDGRVRLTTGTNANEAVTKGYVETHLWGRWSGTQAEYDALGSYDNNVLYVIV